MKKLFFILTIFMMTCSCIKGVQGQNICEKYRKIPQIKFYTSYGKLNYDRTLSRQELTKLGKSYGIVEHGLFASGLATIGVSYQVSVKVSSKLIDEEQYCIIPENINIYIGYKKPTIYIAKDLEEGECEYNLVLRHEQTHQQINIAALEYFIPQFQKASIFLINNTPIQQTKTSNDVERITEELSKIYMNKLEPLINFFKTELLQEQHKLDNQENYQFEGDLCRYYKLHH